MSWINSNQSQNMESIPYIYQFPHSDELRDTLSFPCIFFIFLIIVFLYSLLFYWLLPLSLLLLLTLLLPLLLLSLTYWIQSIKFSSILFPSGPVVGSCCLIVRFVMFCFLFCISALFASLVCMSYILKMEKHNKNLTK